MPRRITAKDFECTLIGLSGGVFLYREGIDEFFLSHGFPGANEDLKALRGRLESCGVFEVCRHALLEAERLVRLGPEFDEEAYSLLAEAAKDLMQASGTWDAMERRFRPDNDPKAGA